MSHQTKMLFALCLVAGLVALASAQSFDMQSCSRGFQTQVDRYRQRVMQAAQKFSNELQQTGSSATDLAPFQKDVEKLTNSWAQMTSTVSQGFDMTKFMQLYMENLSTAASMMRNGFRAGLFGNMLTSYMDMGNQIFSANTQFLQSVTDSCMPTRLNRVQQPTVVV